VVAVEAVCGVIDGVGDDDAAAGPVVGVDDPFERVEEQLGAESLAVEVLSRASRPMRYPGTWL
jgi:hypothetical protein